MPKNKSDQCIQPLSEKFYKIQFKASEQFSKKLQRAKEVLSHKYPQARLEDIFNEALELLLEKKDPSRKFFQRKNAQSEKNIKSKQKIACIERSNDEIPKSREDQALQKRPTESNTHLKPQNDMAKKNDSASTRYIPQEIRRQVFKRDNGVCVYQAPGGKRCGERAFLEVDHIQPFSLGGKSTAENLQLLCRAHNRYRAEQTFGVWPS